MYLFSYFREFAPALHLAMSDDLLNWTDLSEEEPLLEPQLGERYWRDPCIFRDMNGVFHLFCTNSWHSQSIDHATSQNLHRMVTPRDATCDGCFSECNRHLGTRSLF